MTGVNWVEHAKEYAKNGGDANAVYEIPFSRLYVIHFWEHSTGGGKVVIDSPESYWEWRNENRRKKGLPPIGPDAKKG